MGKLLVFVVMLAAIVAAIILVSGWLNRMNNRNRRERAGLGDSKRQMLELGHKARRAETVLADLRDLAKGSVAVGEGDPLWEVVVRRIDAVLDNEGKLK